QTNKPKRVIVFRQDSQTCADAQQNVITSSAFILNQQKTIKRRHGKKRSKNAMSQIALRFPNHLRNIKKRQNRHHAARRTAGKPAGAKISQEISAKQKRVFEQGQRKN